jgi:hypothetical protein
VPVASSSDSAPHSKSHIMAQRVGWASKPARTLQGPLGARHKSGAQRLRAVEDAYPTRALGQHTDANSDADRSNSLLKNVYLTDWQKNRFRIHPSLTAKNTCVGAIMEFQLYV